jgi:hypothetical protein
MPICEADPWRMQYFEDAACPPDLMIPVEDYDSWSWFPDHRWVYNKIEVALSQGLDAAPHGVRPRAFPVFSKPIINMNGMGAGSRVLRTYQDYLAHYAPGHMWMPLLEGLHVSSDVAVVNGTPAWWRHATGKPGVEGTFDYWTVHAAPDGGIEQRSGDWIRKNLVGYTGMMNLETIGGTIIEAHLRFADQWPDLYGKGWVDAMVGLYQRGRWDYADNDRREGYSVALFGPHGPRYRHPPHALIEETRAIPSVSSVQITFYEGDAPDTHSMPPGGFRLAVINCWDLDAGIAARKKLEAFFAAS